MKCKKKKKIFFFKVVFASEDFGVYCDNPLDMLLVELPGWILLQFSKAGHFVYWSRDSQEVLWCKRMSVAVPAWPSATCPKLSSEEAQGVWQWVQLLEPRVWDCLGSCTLNAPILSCSFFLHGTTLSSAGHSQDLAGVI